jgi:hypothetical protein
MVFGGIDNHFIGVIAGLTRNLAPIRSMNTTKKVTKVG